MSGALWSPMWEMGPEAQLAVPRQRIGALSAALGALRATSTPVPCSKKPAGSGSSWLFSPEHIAW